MENKEAHSYSNVSNICCDLCLSTFGQNNIAEGFCVNCSYNLCKNCCKYHKTLGVTKDHVVFQDKDIPQRRNPEKVKERFTDTCVVHQDNVIDHFCSVCDQFCCSLCVRDKHNTCDKLEVITDVTNDCNVECVLKSLQDIAKELEKNKSKLTSNEQMMKDLKETAGSRINGQREALFRLVDQIKYDFENSIEKLEHDTHSKLKSVSRLNDTLKSDLDSVILEIKNAQQEGKCGLFKAIKKTNTELPLLQEGLKKLDNDNGIETYHGNLSRKTDQVVTHLKELVHIVQGACIRMHHS